MNLFEKIADIFFAVFGITKPTAAARRRAAWFFFLLMTLVAVGLVGAAFLLYHLIHA